MDFSGLKAIHEQKAKEQKEAKLRHEDAVALIGLQETVIKSFSTLVDYLEGRTSKTVVVNQLKEVGTPDVKEVVSALNQLHDTLKTHKNTDLTEITSVMKSVLDEAKKLPKDKVEISIPEQKDYVAQFKSLTDAVKAVEKVVKEQKLVAEAPIVNVDPQVNVEAPDLKPLQSAIKEVVTAVNKVVIPEYKTDNAKVEKLLEKSNKLLKDLLDKPVGSGGGGGGGTWVAIDENEVPQPIQLENGRVSVSTSPLSGYLVADEEDTGTYAYTGFENKDGYWCIQRETLASGAYRYAAGTSNYSTAWTNRASQTYQYPSQTF